VHRLGVYNSLLIATSGGRGSGCCLWNAWLEDSDDSDDDSNLSDDFDEIKN